MKHERLARVATVKRGRAGAGSAATDRQPPRRVQLPAAHDVTTSDTVEVTACGESRLQRQARTPALSTTQDMPGSTSGQQARDGPKQAPKLPARMQLRRVRRPE